MTTCLYRRQAPVCTPSDHSEITCEYLQVPATLPLHSHIRRIYELYSDYVLKNPFYEVEQVRLVECN